MPNNTPTKAVKETGRLLAKIMPLLILLILLTTKGESTIFSNSAINIIVDLIIALAGGGGLHLINKMLNKQRPTGTKKAKAASDMKNVLTRSILIFALMQIFLVLTYWSTQINPLLHILDIFTIPGYFVLTSFTSILIASVMTGFNRIYNKKTIGKLPRLLRYDSKLNEALNNLSIILTTTITITLSLLINSITNPLAFFIALPTVIITLFVALRILLPKILQTIGLLRTASLKLMQHASNNNEQKSNAETRSLLNTTTKSRNDTNWLLRQFEISTLRHRSITSVNTILTGTILLSTQITTILAGIFLAQSLVSYQDSNWGTTKTENAQNLAPWRGTISALLLLHATFSSTFDIKKLIEEITSIAGHTESNSSLLPITITTDHQSPETEAETETISPTEENPNTDTSSEFSDIVP